LRAVLLQWNDPKHTRNHRFRLIGNQDLSMFFNALQVYGRKLAITTVIPARPATKSQSEDRFDIKGLRANLGMSQKVFADTFGFTCGAVREQGRTSPGRSARIRLHAIAQDPNRLVLRSNWLDA
jgi:DNA-binding transcriptional regulator YiaG